MLPDVLGESCETSMAHVFYVAVLREKAATADGSGSTVAEKMKFSIDGNSFINCEMETGCLLSMKTPSFFLRGGQGHSWQGWPSQSSSFQRPGSRTLRWKPSMG